MANLCNSWKTAEEHKPFTEWTEEDMENIALFLEGNVKHSFVKPALRRWNAEAKKRKYDNAMKAIR